MSSSLSSSSLSLPPIRKKVSNSNALEERLEMLERENTEIKSLLASRDANIAILFGEVVRIGSLVETSLQSHKRDTQLLKSDTIRRIDNLASDISARDVQRATDRTIEYKQLVGQITSLETLMLSNISQLKEKISNTSSTFESRTQSLVNDINNAVLLLNNKDNDSSTKMILERIADLNEATKDVTADLQIKLADLEEVLRMEVKTRVQDSEKLRTNIHTLKTGFTRAIDSLNTAPSTNTSNNTDPQVVEAIVLQVLESKDSSSVPSINNNNNDLETLKLQNMVSQLSATVTTHLAEVETLKAQVNDAADISAAALEGLSSSILKVQQEGFDKSVSLRREVRGEVEDTANELNEVISTWAFNFENQVKSATEEIAVALKSMTSTQEAFTTKSENNIEFLEKSFNTELSDLVIAATVRDLVNDTIINNNNNTIVSEDSKRNGDDDSSNTINITALGDRMTGMSTRFANELQSMRNEFQISLNKQELNQDERNILEE